MSQKTVVLAIILLLGFTIFSCQKLINVETETEAIKKVLQAQLEAAKSGSVEGEAEVWAHQPYIARVEVVGWDSVRTFYEANFPQWEKEYQIQEFTASNFDIYINANFAAVFYDEKLVGTRNDEDISRENRLLKYLEKINGEWKIITTF
jgi:hypothetical protein